MALFTFFKHVHRHRLDPNPDPVAVAKLHSYCLHLHRHLLPRLGLFQTFDLHFVAARSLGQNVLGQYSAGSWRKPAVLLDVQTCRELADQRGWKRAYVYNSTVLHELAHAIQDAHGMPFDETEAEDFALAYYRDGTVNRFWAMP